MGDVLLPVPAVGEERVLLRAAHMRAAAVRGQLDRHERYPAEAAVQDHLVAKDDPLIGHDVHEVGPVLDVLAHSRRRERTPGDLVPADPEVQLIVGCSRLAGNAEPPLSQRGIGEGREHAIRWHRQVERQRERSVEDVPVSFGHVSASRRAVERGIKAHPLILPARWHHSVTSGPRADGRLSRWHAGFAILHGEQDLTAATRSGKAGPVIGTGL
jgi:hypothetical protein